MPRQPIDNVGSRYHTCDVIGCGITLRARSDLTRHAKVHLEDKTAFLHYCDISGCKYATLQKSNLKTHMRIHNKDKSQVCPDHILNDDGTVVSCSFRTTDPGTLTRHRKRLHGYNPPPRNHIRKTGGKESSVGESVASGSGVSMVASPPEVPPEPEHNTYPPSDLSLSLSVTHQSPPSSSKFPQQISELDFLMYSDDLSALSGQGMTSFNNPVPSDNVAQARTAEVMDRSGLANAGSGTTNVLLGTSSFYRTQPLTQKSSSFQSLPPYMDRSDLDTPSALLASEAERMLLGNGYLPPLLCAPTDWFVTISQSTLTPTYTTHASPAVLQSIGRSLPSASDLLTSFAVTNASALQLDVWQDNCNNCAI